MSSLKKDEQAPLLETTSSVDNNQKSNSSKLRETGIIITLLTVQFLMTSVDYMPVPFLPYEGGLRGLTEIQIGVIVGSYELAKTLTAPFCDRMISTLTARRALLMGCVICGISSICFGLIGYTHGWQMFWLSIVFRVISGVCAALNNVCTASITLKSKSYSTVQLFGWLDMSIVVGFAGGYFVGGILYKFLGYVLTFVTVGIVILTAVILLWIITPDVSDDGEGETYFSMLKIPGVMMMFMVCFVEEMSIIASMTMLSLWLTDTYDIDVANAGFIYAVWPTAYVISTPLSIWVTEKGLVCSTVMFSLFSLATVYFLICPSPLLLAIIPHYHHPLWVVIMLTAILGVVIAFILVPVFQSALNVSIIHGYDADNMHIFAKLSAVFYSGLSFGSFFGPPLSGVLTQTVGYPWLQTVLAFQAFLMFILFTLYIVCMKVRHQPLKPARLEGTTGS